MSSQICPSVSPRKNVGIIGGMGPYAGVNYLECFLQECSTLIAASGDELTDQLYPPHYLFQLPVVDRTEALLMSEEERQRVFRQICDQLVAMRRLKVEVAAIACNTAHAWHAQLQQAVPQVKIIHIAEVCARFLVEVGVTRVCLLGTAGTIRSGLYATALDARGIECIEPTAEELDTLMAGIYRGVKANDRILGQACFATVVSSMRQRTGVKNFLMACTEIPLVLKADELAATVSLFDPTLISAKFLAQSAFSED